MPAGPGGRAGGPPSRGGAEPGSHLPPGPADGVVRTSAPLDGARAGAAVTTLQARAFERLRPWASARLDLTVNVTPASRWPPRCLPALLL